MKYIAVFDVPDGYVMGCAIAMICKDDDKPIRTEDDYQKVYAQTEPLASKPEEAFDRFNAIIRIIQDLGLSNAYDMPSFWINNGKDYKVIETRYNKGYAQALSDVEESVRLRFGFEKR